MDNDFVKPEPKTVRIGNIEVRLFDLIFIILCNLSFILIIINAIIRDTFWCHYPILAFFYVYTIAFAASAGYAKGFLARFRNGMFALNFLVSAAGTLYNLFNEVDNFFIFNWFLPISFIVTCIVMIVTTFFKTVKLSQLMLSLIIIFPQVLTLFIITLVGVTQADSTATILVSIAFALYIVVFIDCAFIYLLRFRNNFTRK